MFLFIIKTQIDLGTHTIYLEGEIRAGACFRPDLKKPEAENLGSTAGSRNQDQAYPKPQKA
jgi:hypothetical protein